MMGKGFTCALYPDALTNTCPEDGPRTRQALEVLKSADGSLDCVLFVINVFVDRFMFC